MQHRNLIDIKIALCRFSSFKFNSEWNAINELDEVISPKVGKFE